MVWVDIVLLVLKFVTDPEVLEWIRRIFEALTHARPLQAAKEGAHILIALKAKAEQRDTSGPCPVMSCALHLEAKYPASK